MRIERLEPSKRVQGRVLAYLSDGSVLKITEQELLDFRLRAGDALDAETLCRLRESAVSSDAKAMAAALVGRRAMSQSDLEQKLQEKGVTSKDARAASEWLLSIGALDDAAYAAMLVRHCADRGYGPARYRQELGKHGIDRSLWDDAVAEAPEAVELAVQYLRHRFQDGIPDDKERRRASDALVRRGFVWSDIRQALAEYEGSFSSP